MKAWRITTRILHFSARHGIHTLGAWHSAWRAWYPTVVQRSGLARERMWARWVARWMLVSLAAHLIAVASSQGFFQADEHFQIVEFVSYKLGKTESSQLPAEFQTRTAPWLQSAVYMGIVQASQALGSDNPFQWALGFRLMSALLGWLAILGLTLCAYQWIDDKGWRQMAVLLYAVMWFVPAFHARHSSENTGGALFFIGLSLFTLSLPTGKKATLGPRIGVLTGLLFGLALQTRFQTGWMILGWCAWALFKYRMKIKTWGNLLLGFAVAQAIGAFADRWGYGEWVAPLWNSIVTQLPWEGWSFSVLWSPFLEALTRSWPILGVLTYFILSFGPLFRRGNVLAWCCLPLTIWLHTTPNQALHNFFPLLHVAPLLLVFALQYVAEIGFEPSRLWKQRRMRWVVGTVVGLNFLGLIVTTLMPAWMPAQFYSRLYGYRGYAMNIHYMGDENPFQVLGLTLHFYKPEHVIATPVAQFPDFVQKLEDTRSTAWLFSKSPNLPGDAGVLQSWCSPTIQTLPSPVESVRHFAFPKVQNWTLFKCQAPERAFASREDGPTRKPASAKVLKPSAAAPEQEETQNSPLNAPSAEQQLENDPEFSPVTPSLSHSSI